ncbi:hypothetical protein ACFQVC_12645 [Streptomyces monticola]|uniref:PH domain-containing protein n=1 Tax=Streptomyces monticola TaxID=2666263 RepID=A0ABW2JGY1_9ACTN
MPDRSDHAFVLPPQRGLRILTGTLRVVLPVFLVTLVFTLLRDPAYAVLAPAFGAVAFLCVLTSLSVKPLRIDSEGVTAARGGTHTWEQIKGVRLSGVHLGLKLRERPLDSRPYTMVHMDGTFLPKRVVLERHAAVAAALERFAPQRCEVVAAHRWQRGEPSRG